MSKVHFCNFTEIQVPENTVGWVGCRKGSQEDFQNLCDVYRISVACQEALRESNGPVVLFSGKRPDVSLGSILTHGCYILKERFEETKQTWYSADCSVIVLGSDTAQAVQGFYSSVIFDIGYKGLSLGEMFIRYIGLTGFRILDFEYFLKGENSSMFIGTATIV